MKKKNKAGTFFTPVVAVTGIFLAVIVFVSLFASVIAPYDPLATRIPPYEGTNGYASPNALHWPTDYTI